MSENQMVALGDARQIIEDHSSQLVTVSPDQIRMGQVDENWILDLQNQDTIQHCIGKRADQFLHEELGWPLKRNAG